MRDEVFHFLNRHATVSRETCDRLIAYHDLLLKWQSKINLVGADTIKDVWKRHFLDSLQLLSLLPDISKRIVDLGSGGGFPGMVLAIAGASDMHLVEGDVRKVAFLREVARITSTRVFIHHCRIESTPVHNVDIVISRACSDLDSLLHYASGYVSHETFYLFLKGKNFSKDIVDAESHWLFECDVVPSVTDTHGVILKLSSVRKRVCQQAPSPPGNQGF